MRPALEIIPGGRSESQDALRMLYERHGAAVRGRCRYLLKDASEAEDAMHEVFARALTHLHSFRGEAAPLTWLLQIATRHCLNELRSKKAGWREEVQRIAQLQPVGDGAPVEGRDLVRALLAQFDLETQTAAVHYYVDEMTLEEVAHAIGRSVPTVRKRLAAFAGAARRHAERLSGTTSPAEEGHG